MIVVGTHLDKLSTKPQKEECRRCLDFIGEAVHRGRLHRVKLHRGRLHRGRLHRGRLHRVRLHWVRLHSCIHTDTGAPQYMY